MLLFWISLVIALVVYLVLRQFRYPKADDATFVIVLLSISFLIVAIVTKDPLFAGFGVPAEFEWIVGLFLAALTSWKLYFNPLKGRVIKAEIDISSLRSDVQSIKADTTLIKEKVLKL